MGLDIGRPSLVPSLPSILHVWGSEVWEPPKVRTFRFSPLQKTLVPFNPKYMYCACYNQHYSHTKMKLRQKSKMVWGGKYKHEHTHRALNQLPTYIQFNQNLPLHCLPLPLHCLPLPALPHLSCCLPTGLHYLACHHSQTNPLPRHHCLSSHCSLHQLLQPQPADIIQ